MERKEQIRQMIQNLIFDKKDEAKPNLSAAMTEHGKQFFGIVKQEAQAAAVQEAKEVVEDVSVSVDKPEEFQDETADDVAGEYGVTLKVLKKNLKVSGSPKAVKKFVKEVVYPYMKPKQFKEMCEDKFPELC